MGSCLNQDTRNRPTVVWKEFGKDKGLGKIVELEAEIAEVRRQERKMLNRLKAVFGSFQRHDVGYVVIGGIPSVIHGVPRATFDLDILIGAESFRTGPWRRSAARRGIMTGF